MSPALSFGTKEYGCPHFVQKPSVRPRLSPRERPTGAPQSDREQNRLRSGTSAFFITAECGSGRGTSGTETRPAPSRLRPDEPDGVPELRTETDGDVLVPERERERRPDTERREVEDREEREEEREEERDEEREDERELLLPRPDVPLRPPAAMPVGGDDSMPVGETTGASPQVSQ